MADVQPEDGYTALAHPVIEALARSPMPARHLRVVLAVARLTWGWGLKEAEIGSFRIASMTGIDASNVRKVFDDLVRWGVLREGDPGGRGRRSLGIQKDYELWRIASTSDAEKRTTRAGDDPRRRRPASETTRVASDPGTRAGGDPGTRVASDPPLNKKQETSPEPLSEADDPPPEPTPEMADAARLAALLRSEIQRTNPKAKVPRDLGPWTRELERMLRIDRRDAAEVERAIRWLFGVNLLDEVSFVVLSAEALRKKYDRVSIQMARPPRGSRGRRSATAGWTREGDVESG